MGDTFRERKQAYGTLGTSAKIELVEALRREKEKSARHLADARTQRERAKEAGLKHKIVVDPSASRPFKNLIVQASSNHTALTKLDFSVGAWWLSGSDVLMLAEVLKHNTTIADVNFHGNSLAAQGAAALADMLKINSSITLLNLGGNQITSIGARSLAESLHADSCALRSLLLYSNSITDDGAYALAFALGGTKIETSGPIKGAMVTNEDANTRLTSLDLSANVITCKGATALSESLATNSSLTHLHLTHNVVRDAGAKKVEMALADNWTLLKLSTDGNRFNEATRTNILDLIKRNNKMHTLTLMQVQNQREFERVKDRVQPPDETYRPVRFAHEIDISRTDPRMFAALEMADTLRMTARYKSQRSAVLAERADAVVHAASQVNPQTRMRV